MAKNLTDLTARTTTADSDLIHVNAEGTDYKETKQNFLRGNLAYPFSNTSTLTSQLDTLASEINFGTVHGDISSNGHQAETGMPVNSNGTVFARIFSTGQMSVSFFPNAVSDEYVIFKQGTWGSWEKRPTRAEITSLNNKFTYRDYSVTTGTSLYSTYYYGGVNVDTSLGAIVSVVITSTASNQAAFASIVSGTGVRVFSPISGLTVGVRVVFMKT